jgi:hypothetical protein
VAKRIHCHAAVHPSDLSWEVGYVVKRPPPFVSAIGYCPPDVLAVTSPEAFVCVFLRLRSDVLAVAVSRTVVP